MDRMTTAMIGGKNRHFNFSISVLFDVVDKYGSTGAMLDALRSEGRESFQAVVWTAVKMQNDAECIRRDRGFDAEPMMEEKDFYERMSPAEFLVLKRAVSDAITNGFKMETDEDREVDMILEEIEAKKEPAGD